MDIKRFFDNIAHKWDEISKHDELKLRKIIELSNVIPNSNILDVGSGTGILIKYLLKTNPNKITAIDISEKMIEKAKEKYNDIRINFIAKDIFEFSEDRYDYVFLYSVYPHIEDKDKLFKHILSLLNPGGKIIIAHSESKEKINQIHKTIDSFKHLLLPPVEETEKLMQKYFNICIKIDDDSMYYISGQKPAKE
ncbi:class I SAM-dependent methyltransferase [Caloramator sp. CAR-1]|uniref:class I SAM-dependent methyltransferase n=1 Tax=Caloramator sp. CAR-1 TaxID=3062777 RepID=UPI0026E34619|nr:class I SAM-dependent methyltransferase [Caloramator sp. CAR-1]MDO6354363.1 class I SAM-dependent methyltransferase [Caloramator sp. CAR-1]